MLRVRTIFTGVAGTPWYSNLYFEPEDSPADAVGRVAEFWAGWAPNMTNLVSYVVQGAVVSIDQFSGETVGSFSVDPVTGVGGASGDPLPYANQLLISLRTGLYVGGREVRGRMFLPGITEPAVTGGRIDPALVTAILGVADDTFIDNDPDGPATLQVYSPKAHTATPVSGFTGNSTVAILRSRRD